MAATGLHFHQPVFAVLGIQGEGLPHQNRCGDQPEPDAEPLVHTRQVHYHKEYEKSQQTAHENEQVLRFQPQAKHPAPCRISTVGFQELASEPDLQVSLYPALH